MQASLCVLFSVCLLLALATAVQDENLVQRRFHRARTDTEDRAQTKWTAQGGRFSLVSSLLYRDPAGGLPAIMDDPIVSAVRVFLKGSSDTFDVDAALHGALEALSELSPKKEKLVEDIKGADEVRQKLLTERTKINMDSSLAVQQLEDAERELTKAKVEKNGEKIAEVQKQLKKITEEIVSIDFRRRMNSEDIMDNNLYRQNRLDELERLGDVTGLQGFAEQLLKNKAPFTAVTKSIEKLRGLYKVAKGKMCSRKFQVLGAGPVGLSAAIELSLLGCTVHMYETRPHPVMQHVVNMVSTSTQENDKVPEFVEVGNLDKGMRTLFEKLFDMSEMTDLVELREVSTEESVIMSSVRDIQLYLMFAFAALRKDTSTFTVSVINRGGLRPATSVKLSDALDAGKLTEFPAATFSLLAPSDGAGKDPYFFVLRNDVDMIIHATSSTLRGNIFSGDVEVRNGKFSLNVLDIETGKTLTEQQARPMNKKIVKLEFELCPTFETLSGTKTELAKISTLQTDAVKNLASLAKNFWYGKEGVATIMMNFPATRAYCKYLHGPNGITAKTFPDAGDGGIAPMIRAAGVFSKFFHDSQTKQGYCQFELTMQPSFSKYFMQYFGMFRYPSVYNKDNDEDVKKLYAVLTFVRDAVPTLLTGYNGNVKIIGGDRQKSDVAAGFAGFGTLGDLVKVVREVKIWQSKPHMLLGQSVSSNSIPFAGFKSVYKTKTQYHVLAGDAVRDPFTFFAMGVNDGYFHAWKLASLLEANTFNPEKTMEQYNANIATRALLFTSVIQRNAFNMFNSLPDRRQVVCKAQATKDIQLVFEDHEFHDMTVKI